MRFLRKRALVTTNEGPDKPRETGLLCIRFLSKLDWIRSREISDILGLEERGKRVASIAWFFFDKSNVLKYFVLAYEWAVWEPFFVLPAGIEKSGWKWKGEGTFPNPSKL